MSFHSGLAGNEDFVIGLGLIGHHAQLVGLTMIDVDMDHRSKAERLEIRHSVVDVQSELEVIGVVEGLQGIEPSFEHHGEVSGFQHAGQG